MINAWSYFFHDYRYRGIVQDRADKAFFAIQASTWQLIGTIFYVVGEIMDDFKHLPGNVSWAWLIS